MVNYNIIFFMVESY